MRIRVHSRRHSGFAAACGVVVAMAVVAALPAGAGNAVTSVQSQPLTSATTAVAAGKQAHKRISGRLDKPGYTVIALAPNGKARVVRARKGAFRVVAPAARVSLQLRAPSGKYAGPVVVGRKGGRAVVGVRAGTYLGKVVVHPAYAKVARRLPRAAVDTSRWARARHGVPIGAGRFGRVRSKPPKNPPAGDRDADGVPDVIDIDDDGDLVIDNVDRSKAARTAQAALTEETVQPDSIHVKSLLGAPLWRTGNANSPALVDAIGAADGLWGQQLMIEIAPGDFVELDCGGANQATPRTEGLVYCSHGGTGYAEVGYRNLPPFPDAFDPDGNGMGNLTPNPTGAVGDALALITRATASQIGTGDVLVERITDNGVQSQLTGTLQYMFATVPALVSYDDGHGGPVAVQYPVAYGEPGSLQNGFPVAADSNGHVVVTLTFWRPQRAAIPPETAPWIDMGHLSYGVGIYSTGQECPRSSFSNPGPSLVEADSAFSRTGARYTDQADDQPANPANLLSFTVDLTDCLSAHGRTFEPGTTGDFDLEAKACGGDRCIFPESPDSAGQSISFTRQ
ncbi:MAG: hypothetical protein IPG68_09110 [Micrococcales bacterium]|nr:hypothetical protein [Micrococcales bacterium]